MTIKSVDFPNKTFESKEDLFKSLKDNKDILVASKKSNIYKSCEKGLAVTTNQESIKKIAEQTKAFEMENDYYYFVVNSSNILDSHLDMHIDGNWEKSVKEQQGKVYLVSDHSLKIGDVISMKSDIEMFTATIPFSLIGKNYSGDTYCLIYKVKKDRIINEHAEKFIEKGYELEASVRMQYMDIDIAIDSNSPDYAKEKETFDKYYPLIANKEDFQPGEIYYFWVVKQAKNVYESSLVLFGSNPATGIIQEDKNKQSEPDNHSDQNNEPPEGTQPTKKLTFLKLKN